MTTKMRFLAHKKCKTKKQINSNFLMGQFKIIMIERAKNATVSIRLSNGSLSTAGLMPPRRGPVEDHQTLRR